MQTQRNIYCSLALLLFLAGCGDSDSSADSTEAPLRPVRYITVNTFDMATTRTFSGLSKSGQESNLSFRVSGPVKSLSVEVGDRVKKGQVIATIDPAQYQLQAQQSKASLAQAEASLRNAEANFERIKGLYENNNISRNELDSARATAESSKAQVSAERKALELANLDVSYTRLTATDSCDVAEVLTEMNENISPGETVVSVNCGEKIEVELGVPESTIAQIARGMNAIVEFSALPEQNFMANVTEVGVAATSGTTYPVTLELKDNDSELRSGLAAQVTFSFDNGSANTNILLPAVAVGEDVNGRYVYKVNNTNEASVGEIERQAVSIGELTTNGLEIMDGLAAGDKVVTAGISVIRPGLKVLLD
ncbi:MAG: efflux RND transporter periplasmic adaptor subunit [Pseudomonadota bacterium]